MGTAASGIGYAAAKKFARCVQQLRAGLDRRHRFARYSSLSPFSSHFPYFGCAYTPTTLYCVIAVARHGLHVVLADANAQALAIAEQKIADIAGKDNVLSVVTDVAQLDQVEHLRDEAMAKFGEASITLASTPSTSGFPTGDGMLANLNNGANHP